VARDKKLVTAMGSTTIGASPGRGPSRDRRAGGRSGSGSSRSASSRRRSGSGISSGKREVYDEYIMSGSAFQPPIYTNLQGPSGAEDRSQVRGAQERGVQYHTYGWPAPPSDKVQLITNSFILPNMLAKAVTGTPTREAIAWAEKRDAEDQSPVAEPGGGRERRRRRGRAPAPAGADPGAARPRAGPWPLFITPALILIVLLVAYPFCVALYFSVSNAFIGRPSHFVGLKNFINLWESDAFRQTFQNAFVFTGTAVACKLVLGISLRPAPQPAALVQAG